jgi:predicted RNase H-like HicB family nuclease
MTYLVIYERTKTGYSAYVPDLPGCVTVGRTQEETMQHMGEAIDLHLEGMREDGLPIPPPTTSAYYYSSQERKKDIADALAARREARKKGTKSLQQLQSKQKKT